MGIVYVLGAGFSKTCGIAVDIEMLDSLNPLLTRSPDKGGSSTTCIDRFIDQNFRGQQHVGFEEFMSTISALKFLPEFAQVEPNVFEDAEREIRNALKRYLRDELENIQWGDGGGGKAILDFARHINWQQDTVLTFNYDLLLEEAAKLLQIDTGERILHLHGATNKNDIAWPTYKKFAYRNIRTKLGSQWNRAFQVLRDREKSLSHVIFIGYSMPPTDMEARGLFNYTDWYNHGELLLARRGTLLPRKPVDRYYSYQITVVNPNPDVKRNYEFFRKDIRFCAQTMGQWLANPCIRDSPKH
jgi:hypothetical protein